MSTSEQQIEVSGRRPLLRSPALFPNQYAWFVFLSVMDVLLTVLAIQNGARESNVLAAWLLSEFGAGGLVFLKFTAVPVVIMLCEVVGRAKPATGRRLAEWVVALAAIPIVIALVLLLTTGGR